MNLCSIRFLVSIIIAIILVNGLQAQVKSKTIDVSKYKTYEECISLQNRLIARERRKLPYWKDSLEYIRSDKLNEYSKAVTDTVAICMSKFTSQNVNLNNHTEYLDWITIFYDIGRDSDAESVINRKLSNAVWDTIGVVEGRHNIVAAVVRSLVRVRPIPWDAIVRIARMVDSPDAICPLHERISIYATMMSLSRELNDTLTHKYVAEKMVELEKGLSVEEKSSYTWQSQGRYTLLEAMDFLNHHEMLDSLRKSPQAYLSYRNSYWAMIRGQSSDKLPNHVGETAKPIIADFWFTRQEDRVSQINSLAESIPEAGKVNLIVFLEIICSRNTPVFGSSSHRSLPISGPCLPAYYSLRRLGERYPNLKLTIVSHTDGYIGLTEPLTPEQEAKHKSQWWLGTHRIPAVLAVAEQKYFRLPKPDERRIDEPHDNSLNYRFGNPDARIPSGKAFLVDVDGSILYSAEINPITERKFNELLKAVTNRKQ